MVNAQENAETAVTLPSTDIAGLIINAKPMA
jgi:hypothetical protein